MLLGAILISLVIPASINMSQPSDIALKPYIVQAVIDAAQIAGLPASKAAKAHAIKIQLVDPVFLQVTTYTPEPVSTRQLFFRKYFQTGGV